MNRLGLVGLGWGKACDIVGRIIVVILKKRLVTGHWPVLDPSHNHHGTM